MTERTRRILILICLGLICLTMSCSTLTMTDDELIDWLSTPVPVVISK